MCWSRWRRAGPLWGTGWQQWRPQAPAHLSLTPCWWALCSSHTTRYAPCVQTRTHTHVTHVVADISDAPASISHTLAVVLRAACSMHAAARCVSSERSHISNCRGLQAFEELYPEMRLLKLAGRPAGEYFSNASTANLALQLNCLTVPGAALKRDEMWPGRLLRTAGYGAIKVVSNGWVPCTQH